MKIRFLLLPIVAAAIAIVLLSGPADEPLPTPPGGECEKCRDEKVILELKMIPVDDSPGEYILEYSNGNREYLKKDGTRVPLSK